MRIGILSEFPSPSVQSGISLQSQFLLNGLTRRGHQVVMMGPDTRRECSLNGQEAHLYVGVPYPTHRSVRIGLPGPSLKHLWRGPEVDLVHCQSNTHMADYAHWCRLMWQIPVLNTHTVHIPAHSHFVLNDALFRNQRVREAVYRSAVNFEREYAALYNRSDCLIVQSRFFVDYWRERGVTVPIEVVGRPIDPKKFSAQPNEDPYPAHFAAGHRLVVVSRHDREKRLDHLVDVFARLVAPRDPKATLTLVGDGHGHRALVDQARATPYADRIHFPGEVGHDRTVDWYAHGDVFVYTSVSETFGNVVNEALWCGLPVVALDDRMGVAHQVADGINGFLLAPDRSDTDEEFASSCLLLTGSAPTRRKMGEQAANLSRMSSHPDVVLRRFEGIYERARERCLKTVPVPLSTRSRLAQARAFASHVGRWAWWNGLLLSAAYAVNSVGAQRKGGASQHEAVMREVEAQQPELAARRPAA